MPVMTPKHSHLPSQFVQSHAVQRHVLQGHVLQRHHGGYSAKPNGFSFIEVLITAVVIALGLVGLTQMQITGFGAGRAAEFYTHATNAVDDMYNRMHINKAGIESGFYNNISIDTTGAGIPSEPSCSNGCTPEERADMDIREWGAYFHDVYALGSNYSPALPEGATGSITRNASGSYTILITWEESATQRGGDPVSRQVEMEFTL